MIISNIDPITNPVTTWPLTNRQARLIILLGVPCGSDGSPVVKTLIACAKANPKVAKTPKPQVLSLKFGESSPYGCRKFHLPATLIPAQAVIQAVL